MTRSTGFIQVRRVHLGLRIRGRQNVVNSVAAGTIGDFRRTEPAGQAVETIAERGAPVRGEPILAGQLNGIVTGNTRLLGNILSRYRRACAGMFLNGMLIMTARTRRGVRYAVGQSLPMDTLRKLSCNVNMAILVPARRRQVEYIDFRIRMTGAHGLMPTMAVATDGGIHIPTLMCTSMHTFGIVRHKPPRVGHSISDFRCV